MLPYLNIFGAAIPVAEMTILIGVYLGANMAERYAHLHKVDPDKLYNLIFFAVFAGALGARLSFAALNPVAFIANPGNLFSLNQGLLDPWGGLAIGLIASLIYGQRKGLSLWSTLDALVPVLAVLLVAIPLANLASGNGYGAPANLPWSIDLWGALRHPTQLYEALAAAGILWLVWPPRQSERQASGTLFLTLVSSSAAARIFLEAFRGLSPSLFLNLRNVQLIAFVVLVLGLWGLTQKLFEDNNAKAKR